MNTQHTASGPACPDGCHAQSRRVANTRGFGLGYFDTFDPEADGPLVDSLFTLIEFVGNAKNAKTRVVASILVALWDEDRVAPHLQWVGMLDPVTFEHLINVIRLAATGMPLNRHLADGPEVFEEMVRHHGFKRTRP